MQRLLITLGAVFMLMACSSTGAVGEECRGGAAENDCVEGAICTLARSESVTVPAEPNNERFYCRTTCDVASNCPTGFECRRAAGATQRTCQPTTGTTPMGTVDAGP